MREVQSIIDMFPPSAQAVIRARYRQGDWRQDGEGAGGEALAAAMVDALGDTAPWSDGDATRSVLATLDALVEARAQIKRKIGHGALDSASGRLDTRLDSFRAERFAGAWLRHFGEPIYASIESISWHGGVEVSSASGDLRDVDSLGLPAAGWGRVMGHRLSVVGHAFLLSIDPLRWHPSLRVQSFRTTYVTLDLQLEQGVLAEFRPNGQADRSVVCPILAAPGESEAGVARRAPNELDDLESRELGAIQRAAESGEPVRWGDYHTLQAPPVPLRPVARAATVPPTIGDVRGRVPPWSWGCMQTYSEARSERLIVRERVSGREDARSPVPIVSLALAQRSRAPAGRRDRRRARRGIGVCRSI